MLPGVVSEVLWGLHQPGLLASSLIAPPPNPNLGLWALGASQASEAVSCLKVLAQAPL